MQAKITRFDSEQEWLDARKGKVTGTRADNLYMKRGTGYKMGFYEMIAEMIALPPSNESPMDRGHRLEETALDLFAKKIGKKINKDLVIVSREDEPRIAYSPDGLIGKTIDVEVKCLSSARHIEAYLTKKIPSEYHGQMLQGFVVNDSLKKRYFVFYDPNCPIDLFYLEFERKNLKDEIKDALEQQRTAIRTAQELLKTLTF